MEKKRRWYLLWYLAAALGTISLCLNIYHGNIYWATILQFFTIILFIAAGIVNGKRYKQRAKDSWQK